MTTEEQLKKQREEYLKNLEESHRFLDVPKDLSAEEKEAWEYITKILKEGGSYIKKLADVELVTQYMQIKVTRDRAWKEWNQKPEKYIKIVTGICSDGKTPKVMVKENEHYKIFTECNKQLEKLLDDFKLTPKQRTKR